MQFSALFSTTVCIFTFLHSCQAVYDPNAKSNVALYWGQGAGQQRLSYFCAQSAVDIIALAFVDIFPAQGNGFPGTNFGNQCWGLPYVYHGPGNNLSLNELQSECPDLVPDVYVCQNTYAKRIILSLGGSSQTYQLSGQSNGIAFADFLWGAFGPQTVSWVESGLPRPFDGPFGEAVEVDGFDFDIEIPSPDGQLGYIAMASRLRTLFQTASKPYLLTAAPQCVLPDANMGNLIAAVQFDIIWTQFYDTPQCSARSWIAANPKHIDGQPEISSGFGYHNWSMFLRGTASANAKLYIGVLGAPDANDFYLSPSEISSLIDVYYCDAHFGGIMIWEATSADTNPGGPYQAAVKNILTGYDLKPPKLCPSPTSSGTSSARPSSTSSSGPASPTKTSTTAHATSSTMKSSTLSTKMSSIYSTSPSSRTGSTSSSSSSKSLTSITSSHQTSSSSKSSTTNIALKSSTNLHSTSTSKTSTTSSLKSSTSTSQSSRKSSSTSAKLSSTSSTLSTLSKVTTTSSKFLSTSSSKSLTG